MRIKNSKFKIQNSIVCCLLCAVTPIYASRTTQYEIGSIRTAGNVSVKRSEILSIDRVHSRVGELFDPETAAEDAKRIGRLPGVEYSYYNTETVDNKIQLTFVVVERNLVRSIVFVGNRAYRANALRKKLGFEIGDYLDLTLAEAYRRTIAEFYRTKGFAFVDVTLDSDQLSVGKVIYTIDEGPKVRIAKVSFSGNSAIKARALRGAIKTRTTEWFILPAYYVEERPVEDVARLQNIYQAKGFLDAGITARREFSEDKRKVRITFVIDEGPVYAVEKIVLTGNEHFDERELRAELKLEEGQIYSERKAGSDVKRLLKFYRENGFIDAKIERKRGFVSESGVNVEFEITEGERFRIGRVNITGNEQTQDKVIRRVLDEYEFQPGRWYNADIARGDGSGYLEKLLRRTVLTEEATITPSGQTPGQKDAQVNIVEGQTGAWRLIGALSSDRGLVGGLVYEEHNFDISDWPEGLGELLPGPERAFRGAGQKVRVALTPGTREGGYSLTFTEPYFNDKPISLDVSGSIYKVEGDEYNEMSYDKDRTRGYVGFDKRYKNGWRRSVGFRVENVELHGLEPNAPEEITDAEGDNLIAGVRFGIRRDLTDDRFHPSSGYRFNIGYEQVGGDETFGILSGTYRHYGTIYEDLAERKTVLATKLLAATVLGDAPPFEKFYAGGLGTYGIRGFDYWGVSTRGRNPVTGEKKYPVGSNWIFLANAEVAMPLVSEEVSALFFIDSGTIDSGNYRASVGTGIQIQIPQWFGPVPMRIGIAAPFLKDDADETETFFFSVGRLF